MDIFALLARVNIAKHAFVAARAAFETIDADDVLRAAKNLVDNEVTKTMAEVTIKRLFR